MNITPFIWLGVSIIVLLATTIRDIKTLKINTQVNQVMIIFTGIGFLVYPGELLVNILIGCCLFLIVRALNEFFQRTYASGDLELFYWVIPSIFFFDFWAIPLFLFFLSGLYFFQAFLIKYLKLTVFPGTPHILGAYLLSLWVGFIWI